MHKFKELKVWQKSEELAVDLYKITNHFPSEERFGLTAQINRSGVSIASNIAEGAGRNTNGEFDHFLGISVGSSCELETQFIIASELGFISKVKMEETVVRVNEVQNMLFGLKNNLAGKK